MDDAPEPRAEDSRRGVSSWGPPPTPAERDAVRTRLPLGAAGAVAPLPPPRSVLKQLITPPELATAEDDEPRYDVREEIGRGGMGRVVTARDHDLNRDVAMKVLHPQDLTDDALRRFIEEAQVTGQLQHPNVLPVHDFGVNEQGEVFFTMKLVRGHATLAEVIERLRAGDDDAFRLYTFERRVQVVQQVCHALAYAHQRGVVHRDIKPANVVLGGCGEVFLVDWGVAKLQADARRAAPAAVRDEDLVRPSDRLNRNATRAGEWLGTPAYMAPEQALGRQHEVDARTDLYSLAAVLYELLTLNHYLEPLGPRMGDLVAAILRRPPLDAESYAHPKNGRVPRILSRICRKGLAKDPAERFQTAGELEAALQGWLEGNTPVVCPGTAIQRGLSGWNALIDRHPVAVPALSITALVLMLASVVTSVWVLARLV